MRLLLFPLFCFGFCLLGASPGHAQRVILEGITVQFTNHTGKISLPAQATFINNTRVPALFRTTSLAPGSADGNTTSTGFAINFDLIQPDLPRHAFSAGFSQFRLETALYLQTEEVPFMLESSNEYFLVRAGYRYRLRSQRRLSISAGPMIEYGFPVSAMTSEGLGDGFAAGGTEFFAREAGLWIISVPFVLRLKLARSVALKLDTRPSFLLTKLDGTAVQTFMRGGSLAFQFRLRGGAR
ncbi:MAG: hypothetical protein AAF564_05980 [Bacteroidota bacterium]